VLGLKEQTLAINWQEIEKGTDFRIAGERGVFSFQYFRNGEVTLYGGTRAGSIWTNAGFRTVDPSKVVAIKKARSKSNEI